MKKNIPLLFLPVILLYILILIKNNGLLLFSGDGFDIVLPFYMSSSRWLFHYPLDFWNESISYGTNMLSLSEGFLFQPSLIISGFLDKSFTPYFISAYSLLVYLLSLLTSYQWLKNFTKSEEARIIGSVVFSFSGFIIFFMHFLPFIESYLFISLFFLACEKILKEHKFSYLLVMLVSIMSLMSIYFLYMILWFVSFYLIYRYFTLYKSFNLKHFFTFFMVFFKPLLVGMLISMIIFLPSAYTIINSPRLDVSIINYFIPRFSLKDFYNLFSSLYSPILFDFQPNIFISPTIFPSLLPIYVFSLYISPMFLWIYLFNRKIQSKVLNYISLFLIVFSFFPFSNYLFNGNAFDTRWYILLSVLLILMIVQVLEKRQELSKKSIALSLILNLFLLNFFSFISFKLKLTPFGADILQFNALIGSLFFIGYYVYLKNPKYSLILIILLSGEISYALFNRIFDNWKPIYIQHQVIDDLNIKDTVNIVNTTNNLSSDLNRLEFIDVNINHASMFEYSGFNFFSSIYNHNVRSFIDNRFSNGWVVPYSETKEFIKSMMSKKYTISKFPLINDVFGQYTHLKSIDGYEVYENNLTLPIAFATQDTYSIDSLLTFPKSIQDVLMYQAIFTENGTSDIGALIKPNQLTKDESSGLYSLKEPGFLLVDYSTTWPYSECLIENHLSNGDILQTTHNEFAYFWSSTNMQTKELLVFCNSIFTKNQLVDSDVYFLNQSDFDKIKETSLNKIDLNLQQENKNTYSSTFEYTNDKGYVFLSIPYDEGWSLYLNDQKTIIEEANNGFMSFPIQKGNYHMTLKYTPPLLIEGAIVSILTLLSILGFFIWKKS